MRWIEIMETASVAATTAGGMAPVMQPLGAILSRSSVAQRDKYKVMQTKQTRTRTNASR